MKFFILILCILCFDCGAAIVYPAAPEGGRQLVLEEAGRCLRSDPDFLGGFRVEELTIAAPFQSYYVGLKDLASGHLLSAAKSGGNWMYLFLHGKTAVGAAGLIVSEKKGKALKTNGLYQTNLSNETLKALSRAEKLPQIKKQNYEIRRLACMEIYFVAVWLHCESDDIIIPLPPTYERWDAYRSYSESQILKLLEPEAKRALETPGAIRGG